MISIDIRMAKNKLSVTNASAQLKMGFNSVDTCPPVLVTVVVHQCRYSSGSPRSVDTVLILLSSSNLGSSAV